MKCLFLLFPFFLYSSVCYFTPPSDWQCAQPKNMSPHVQVGFVGKGSTEFSPSINLAFEEVDVSLKEYIKAVKGMHLSQKGTSWRDLGKFKLKEGDGRLTEISTTSAWGEVKMLQAIYIRDHKAYILTAAVLKKDYPNLQEKILESLQSLSLVPDLLTSVPQKQSFDEFYSKVNTIPEETTPEQWKKSQWERLQKIVLNDCKEMGGHWQFLVLKEGYSKIYSKEQAEN